MIWRIFSIFFFHFSFEILFCIYFLSTKKLTFFSPGGAGSFLVAMTLLDSPLFFFYLGRWIKGCKWIRISRQLILLLRREKKWNLDFLKTCFYACFHCNKKYSPSIQNYKKSQCDYSVLSFKFKSSQSKQILTSIYLFYIQSLP